MGSKEGTQANIEAVLAANGEYAVRRGPLFYALPLADKKIVTKDYPLAGFHDYDVELKNPNDPGMSYQLNMNESDLGLTAVRSDTVDPLRPWDRAPIKLNGPSISLEPLGTTMLRRFTFSSAAASPESPNKPQTSR